MNISYYDIHSHLNFSDFDEDRTHVIARMEREGVGTITVGTDMQASREAVALAKKHPHLFASVGIHPTHDEAFDAEALEELAKSEKVVALGECGLDYFRIADDDVATKERQRVLFEVHIALAKKLNLPLMIHGRPSAKTMDAYEDIVAILTAHAGVRGNAHFFVGSTDIARKFLDIGFTMSFDGPVTFTQEYDEVIRFIPEDMLMAETDAPFAAPVPYRGKRNEPLYVREITKRLALVRGVDEDMLRRRFLQTAERVFGLPGEIKSF